MEEDLDLSLSSPIKSSGVKQHGRRANRNAFDLDDSAAAAVATAADELLGSSSPVHSRPDLLFQDANKGGLPLKGRRTGGWGEGEETATRAKTAKSVRIQSTKGNNRRMGIAELDADDDDDAAIPDLDEVQDEDMAMQVAEAPSVAVNRVATYRELDSDLLKHIAFATLDDIDLKLLTRSLAPEAALREPDEQWSWDVLFAEISGDLRKEWFPEEEEEEQKQAKKERPYTAFNRFPV